MINTKLATKINTFGIRNRIDMEMNGMFKWFKKVGNGLFGMVLLNVILLLPLSLLYAQDNLRNVPNPDPKFELETLNVADGFEVNLFASEPMLTKPIQMNWDEKGRLWVAGSKNYPQLKPGEIPNDKIYVLEDTTGDGKADVSTIFAEGLHIPTGILPGDGGVYVANSTEILHLKDTDGDGKADQRRVVLSGFGTGDTHHLLHTFRWGPAGRFYFNQSIYIHSRIETPHGVKELEGSGVWRFNPETLELGVYARGLINPWGLRFNKWGQSFLTDGAGSEGINYAFPGATFVSAPGVERTLQGLNPGQPKHSGLEIVSGRHFPQSWQSSLITNDFRANRINRFVLEEQGSGYVSNQVEDLLWSDNVAFRPVDISIGPDGAIYVADWYNPIIQHGEVDFRDPRRDHEHGRIWRIIAKDRPLVRPPQLSGATTTNLLDALKMPEKWTRSQAKRLLKEQGAEAIVPGLKSWIKDLDPTDPDYEHHLLEALWVSQSVDVVNESLLRDLLKAESHKARAAAVRVVKYWYDRIDNAFGLLKRATGDEHPKVRLEAVIALRNEKSARAASAALSVLKLPMDKFLDFALWQTIREFEPDWMAKIETDPDFFGDSKKTAYALKSVNNSQAVKHLVQLYKQGKVPVEFNQDVFNSVAKSGSTEELNIIMDLAMSDKKIHKNRRASYLDVLEEAARHQDKKPNNSLDRIIQFVDEDNEQLAQSAVKLIGHWDLKKFRDKLGNIAREGSKGTKQAALDALVLMDDKESKKLLIDMTGTNQSPELRLMAVKRLVSIDVTEAAGIAVNLLQGMTDKEAASDLFSAFFAQTDGPGILAEELSGQNLPEEIAKEGSKAIQQKIPHHRREDDDVQALKKVLVKLGGELPPEKMPQQLSSQELNRLELDIKASADPKKGEIIFRDINCMSCHAIGGAGGRIGSDVSSLGANAPTDYIIESILNPSASIKDGFELNRIVRKDGSIVSGYFVQETSSEIVIRDVTGQEVSIPRSQVDVHETVPGSLMPPGLTSGLEREEFIDLVGFLSKLGEPGEFRVSNARFVRRWNVMVINDEVATKINKSSLDYIVREDVNIPLQPAYSKVSGNLPIEELPVIELDSNRRYSFIRFEVEVLDAGNIDLSFNSTEGMTVWVGQKPSDLLDHGVVADLSQGIHTITLAIDRRVCKNGALRIQLQDSEHTSAQARLIMGR